MASETLEASMSFRSSSLLLESLPELMSLPSSVIADNLRGIKQVSEFK